MCGIFAIINKSLYKNVASKQIEDAINIGKLRGPENTEALTCQDVSLYFHRLAINGLTNGSMQPITIGNITLICNGEIYNYKQLYEMHPDINPSTESDCEIIIHMYKKYGIKRTLQMLDGVFAFVLHEYNYDKGHIPDRVFIARDPFGVRPLYIYQDQSDGGMVYSIASEIKVLSKLLGKNANYKITPFKPGSYSCFEKPFIVHQPWHLVQHETRYFTLNCHPDVILSNYNNELLPSVCQNIYSNLVKAVKKRVIGTTDRPIACLLSGGLDSSLIAAIVRKFVPELHTFSIGMPGSKDLECAKIVASHINSIHHELVVSKDAFFNAIPNVIENIESYDTTTVRASVGNYLIGKHIAEHFNHKVIFNGDGSDELTGGYIYMLFTPNDLEFDSECKRLLEEMHNFDVLRSDRSISTNGLEPRTPFLDRTLVTEYLSIPASIRNPRSNYNTHCKAWDIHADTYDKKGMTKISETIRSRPEKLLLRYAVDTLDSSLLPSEILWRSKEAFSDGVSGKDESWFEVISKKLSAMKSDLDLTYDMHKYSQTIHMKPTTIEQAYYRALYCTFFPNTDNTVPYFWMPRYVNATDSSARTLAHYNSNN